MNKKAVILIALVLVALTGAVSTRSLADDPDDPVPLNGVAYWATEPTGPDFSGVRLVPFAAQNPTRAVWAETLAQNQAYLTPEALPANTQVSHSGWFTYASNYLNDFSEVMVYLDPTDPNHLLGASKFFYQPATYDFYTGVFESYDGGHTWTQFQPNGVENYSMTSDPVTTFDDQGNGYFTLLTRGPTGLDMLKKPVGGTWQPPVIVDRTTSTDKQWIMGDQNPQGISPYAGYLYMSWTSFGGPATGIVFARSIDGNQSWSSPASVASGDVQGSVPGVAPDGTVYVVFGRNIFYGPTSGTMEFVKSTNGGVSFTSPSVAANMTAIPYFLPNPFGGNNFRSPASLPAFAVSPVDGNLYIAWADYRHGDADIYFTRSTDGGTTWDTAVRLNDDPVGNGIDQFQPQVSVAPNGRVAVMWFDRRLACPDLPWIPAAHVGVYNGCIDTFMTRSFDEGQNWTPNIRASAQSWDWSLNLPWTGSAGFIGDYQGIASNDDYDFPFWNATANLGENPDNYQQIFVARLPVGLAQSTKSVDPGLVGPGDVLTYSLVLANASLDDLPAVHLTDTLPISTTYVPGSLVFPPGSGQGGYDPVGRTITWTGAVSAGLPVTVTFHVTADLALSEGWLITNTAFISDGVDTIFERTATALVGLPPVVLATDPVDGQVGVPVTSSLVVTFSEPMLIGTLAYTVTPDPGGWTAVWSQGDTVVSLTPAGWAYSQTYTATVAAQDPLGLPLASGPAPNPWSFTVEAEPPVPPQILATSPADGEMGVPISASLVVSFSQPMLTGTLAYTLTPDPGGWTVAWSQGDTVATLNPAGWAYSQTYTATLAAQSLDGLPLAPGPAPNPWSFSTEAEPVPPQVLATSPADGVTGVPIDASLVVSFSQPMLTGTLAYTLTPDPGGWTVAWSQGDTVASLTPAAWAYSQTYTATLAAQNLEGLPLASGPAPNPWSFNTEPAPVSAQILATSPADGEADVPINASLVITFSQPMLTGSLAYTVTPDPGGWTATWSLSDTVVSLTPAGWAYSQTYTATVAAQDLDGLPLAPGPAPNPWSFSTEPEPVPPQILETNPADGATGVPISAPLVITFSQPMLTGTLSYTLTPDPGGWTVAWSLSDTVVSLTPTAWAYSQTYTATLAAQNLRGLPLASGPAPNPWSFSTEPEPVPPQILATSPADGEMGVPINASLVITFSQPMLTGTLAYTVTPDPGGWTATWSQGDRVVSLTPAGWAYSQTYTATVAAQNLEGLPLASGPAPNPWSFSTQAREGGFVLYLPVVVKEAP